MNLHTTVPLGQVNLVYHVYALDPQYDVACIVFCLCVPKQTLQPT